MAMDFLDNPVRVTIGSTSLSSNKRITQNVHAMKQTDKDWQLQAIHAVVTPVFVPFQCRFTPF